MMVNFTYRVGTIPISNYGIYKVTYKLGNTNKEKTEILKYIDELTNTEDSLLFENFGTYTTTAIDNKNIVGYMYLGE
jgi:hypothetical protein